MVRLVMTSTAPLIFLFAVIMIKLGITIYALREIARSGGIEEKLLPIFQVSNVQAVVASDLAILVLNPLGTRNRIVETRVHVPTELTEVRGQRGIFNEASWEIATETTPPVFVAASIVARSMGVGKGSKPPLSVSGGAGGTALHETREWDFCAIALGVERSPYGSERVVGGGASITFTALRAETLGGASSVGVSYMTRGMSPVGEVIVDQETGAHLIRTTASVRVASAGFMDEVKLAQHRTMRSVAARDNGQEDGWLVVVPSSGIAWGIGIVSPNNISGKYGFHGACLVTVGQEHAVPFLAAWWCHSRLVRWPVLVVPLTTSDALLSSGLHLAIVIDVLALPHAENHTVPSELAFPFNIADSVRVLRETARASMPVVWAPQAFSIADHLPSSDEKTMMYNASHDSPFVTRDRTHRVQRLPIGVCGTVLMARAGVRDAGSAIKAWFETVNVNPFALASVGHAWLDVPDMASVIALVDYLNGEGVAAVMTYGSSGTSPLAAEASEFWGRKFMSDDEADEALSRLTSTRGTVKITAGFAPVPEVGGVPQLILQLRLNPFNAIFISHNQAPTSRLVGTRNASDVVVRTTNRTAEAATLTCHASSEGPQSVVVVITTPGGSEHHVLNCHIALVTPVMLYALVSHRIESSGATLSSIKIPTPGVEQMFEAISTPVRPAPSSTQVRERLRVAMEYNRGCTGLISRDECDPRETGEMLSAAHRVTLCQLEALPERTRVALGLTLLRSNLALASAQVQGPLMWPLGKPKANMRPQSLHQTYVRIVETLCELLPNVVGSLRQFSGGEEQ